MSKTTHKLMTLASLSSLVLVSAIACNKNNGNTPAPVAKAAEKPAAGVVLSSTKRDAPGYPNADRIYTITEDSGEKISFKPMNGARGDMQFSQASASTGLVYSVVDACKDDACHEVIALISKGSAAKNIESKETAMLFKEGANGLAVTCSKEGNWGGDPVAAYDLLVALCPADKSAPAKDPAPSPTPLNIGHMPE